MAVKYFTPYMLYKDKDLNDLTITYANMNEQGISYNKNDVSFIILKYTKINIYYI